MRAFNFTRPPSIVHAVFDVLAALILQFLRFLLDEALEILQARRLRFSRLPRSRFNQLLIKRHNLFMFAIRIGK